VVTAGAERPRFVALDSWRGIAALAVAFRHINGTAPFLNGPVHGNLSLAVDFFFVLSGFVIAMSYGDRLAQGFSILRFMVLRWGRVWPLHAAMVIAYLLLETGLWLKGPGGGLAGREAFTGPRDPAALLPSLLLVQTWIWPGRDLWNVQSWSISVEIALYIGAAVLWRGLGRGAYPVALALAGIALWLLARTSLPDQMLRGLAGFGLGMACWRLWARAEAFPLPRLHATVAEIGLIAALLLWLAAPVPLAAMDLLFALMVLLFARERGLVSRLLVTAPFQLLGVLSYGIYMVHGMVNGRALDLVQLVQRHLGTHWVDARLGGEDLILLPSVPALALACAMLALSVLAAWCAHLLVERPARDLSRRLAGRIGRQNSAPAAT